MLSHLRTLRLAAWLGWQLETNWASPWLFSLYMIVKPVCGSLMLVFMFYAARAATAGRVPAEFLPYLYISNACFGLVGTVMFGLSYAVVRDREHYRMLKYIYISPGHFQTYFLGRGAARGLEGTVGGVLNIGIGLFLFSELRQSVGVDVPWLIVYLLIGGVMLWACGMILAAACLNMSRNGMFLSEGIAGIVYLLSGVLFPLSVLPVVGASDQPEPADDVLARRDAAGTDGTAERAVPRPALGLEQRRAGAHARGNDGRAGRGRAALLELERTPRLAQRQPGRERGGMMQHLAN